eukprot:12003740-Heterocapsa_arctica.AAC.1
MERVKKEEAEVRKEAKLKVSLEKRMRQEAVLRAPWATGIKQKIRNLSGLHEAEPPPDAQQGDQAMPEAELVEQHDMGDEQGFDWQRGEEDFMDQEVAEQETPETQQGDVGLGEGQGQHS